MKRDYFQFSKKVSESQPTKSSISNKKSAKQELLFWFSMMVVVILVLKRSSLKAEKLFPNIDKPNNRWQLGFSIDENSFVYFHIKDSIGEEKITELGDLIREFRERIIAI